MRLFPHFVALSVLLLICPALAQDSPPKALIQILHCAKTGKFDLLGADLKASSVLRTSYAHQVRFEPYVDEFFLVFRDSRSKGQVYVYARERDHLKTTFYLTNDAGFEINKNGSVSLQDPLYGLWTRNNIARNVKKALRGPTYAIPVKTILGPFPGVGCHSYYE